MNFGILEILRIKYKVSELEAIYLLYSYFVKNKESELPRALIINQKFHPQLQELHSKLIRFRKHEKLDIILKFLDKDSKCTREYIKFRDM